MKVMMIAGEASGDLHGAGVARALCARMPGVSMYGIGGDNMKMEGMELLYHISGLSFMGFAEVVKNLFTIASIEKHLDGVLRQRRPDVVVLIDYPGFNLRFARRAKRYGIPVLYYISPQVWAWNKGRVRKMRRLVDEMKVVFPFEVEIYRSEGINVEFVGHPLAERIGSTSRRDDFFRAHGFDPARKLLGLFPGSRVQEIERILPVMVECAGELTRTLPLQVGISVAPNLGVDALRPFIPDRAPVTLVERATYDLMHHADAAIVTSGTATLETGWFGTPMVVVYRTSTLTYFIGRLLVDVPYIGLVNIVAGKKVVPEFVQHALTVRNLVGAVGRIVREETYARTMRGELGVIRERLGEPGASRRVADSIIKLGAAA
jgi:lipid-A-disaccharide synthase